MAVINLNEARNTATIFAQLRPERGADVLTGSASVIRESLMAPLTRTTMGLDRLVAGRVIEGYTLVPATGGFTAQPVRFGLEAALQAVRELPDVAHTRVIRPRPDYLTRGHD